MKKTFCLVDNYSKTSLTAEMCRFVTQGCFLAINYVIMSYYSSYIHNILFTKSSVRWIEKEGWNNSYVSRFLCQIPVSPVCFKSISQFIS